MAFMMGMVYEIYQKKIHFTKIDWYTWGLFNFADFSGVQV